MMSPCLCDKTCTVSKGVCLLWGVRCISESYGILSLFVTPVLCRCKKLNSFNTMQIISLQISASCRCGATKGQCAKGQTPHHCHWGKHKNVWRDVRFLFLSDHYTHVQQGGWCIKIITCTRILTVQNMMFSSLFRVLDSNMNPQAILTHKNLTQCKISVTFEFILHSLLLTKGIFMQWTMLQQLADKEGMLY